MSEMPRIMTSPYMQWAKMHSHAKYKLATSGIVSYPLADLHIDVTALEINGGEGYGFPPLVDSLAALLGVGSDRIFTTLGTSMANHLAFAVLFDRGDEILVEQPTYELLLSTAGYFGASLKRFPRRFEEDFRINPDEIKRRITPRTKLIVITNLHNPTSALTDESTLREIGTLARSVGARVLVDEVYLQAAYPIAPRSAVHLGDEFVITNSLTKMYGLSGLRCGWIAAEPALIRKLWLLNDLFNVNHSFPAVQMSVAALKQLDRIFGRTKSILEPNRELLGKFLASRSDLRGYHADFGNVVFPKLVKGDSERFCTMLREKYETTVVPGKFFEMPDYIRIGMGQPHDEFREGLSRVGKALNEL